MDPVVVKLVQFVVLEIAGIVILFLGAWLFFRGATGNLELFVKGGAVQARLVNASPGAFLALIGATMAILAATVPEVRQTYRTTTQAGEWKETWLASLANIQPDDGYQQIVEKLTSSSDVVFRVESRMINAETTLGALATEVYGDERYWPIIAAPNSDRGHFTWQEANAGSILSAGILIEVWRADKYQTTDRETWLRVTGPVTTQAKERLLGLARQGSVWGRDVGFSDDLDDILGLEDIVTILRVADTSNLSNIREIAIKYYGEPEYWEVVYWMNASAFSDKSPDAVISGDTTIFVIGFSR